MFPASELRVALDGPATLFGFAERYYGIGCVSPLGRRGNDWLCSQIVGPRQ